jgi:hypothetical protein
MPAENKRYLRKPKSIALATPEEIRTLSAQPSKWDLPDELYDGEWYRLAVAPAEVASLVNSYRGQAEQRFNKKVQTRRKDGFIYVRRLDVPAREE